MKKIKKITVRILTLLTAVLLFSASACSPSIKEPKYKGAVRLARAPSFNEISDGELDQKYISAMKNLGIKLFEDAEYSQNNLYSPVSLSVCMSMILAGAAENSATYSQIQNALGFSSMSPDEILKNNRLAIEKARLSDKKVTLNIDNSVWYNDGKIKLGQSYIDNVQNYFYADLFAQKFSDSSAVKNINDWVNYKTQGAIPKIIDQLSPQDMAIIINTVFFEGEWETKFEKKATAKRNFTMADGTVTQPDFMKGPNKAIYKGTNDFDAVKIPYKGNGMYFLLALPAEGKTPQQLISNANAMETLMSKKWEYSQDVTDYEDYESNQANYYFPKFKFNKSYDQLTDTLKNLGILDAFNRSKADFSTMSPELPVYLSYVKQKTFIDVNEEKTKAAAVTWGGMSCTSAPPPTQTIVFDRPFFFAIMSADSLPLFMGTIANPIY